MKIKNHNNGKQYNKVVPYYSDEQQDQRQKQLFSKNKIYNSSQIKKESIKSENVKKQQLHSSRKNSSNRRPQRIDNKMQIKLEPSDIRFIEKIVQEKHGKILSIAQFDSLKKKMVRQNFKEANPYTELNYNTTQLNQWKDQKRKKLTEEEIISLKKHFLYITKMVDKGQQSKYTLRELALEFNLADSALLQLQRKFLLDPDVSFYVSKTTKNVPQKEFSQIQHIVKKRYMLQKLIQKNPLLTKAQLALKIQRFTKGKVFFPEYEISRLLQQQGFNWRPIVKYPQSRNFTENIQRKKIFCEKINYILTQTKYHVYFLGLMNFNSFMFRTQGWTKDQHIIDPTIDESFTLVALTQRSGEGTWKFQKQVYKQEIFGQTCKILFDNLILESLQPKYVVVDFRLYKYQNVLKKSRKKYDVQIIWIPPFCNLLNPLQFWFQDIRNSLTKSKKMLQLSEQSNLSDQKNQILIQDIYADLKQVFTQKYNNNFDFGQFFQMAAKYHKKALDTEKF